MELILKYFPNLSETQVQQFQNLMPLYQEWNEKINVISRKDMEEFYLHHVLHSLAIAKYIEFKPESAILDLGTGGGFPGIPLAILYPECQFHLVDSVGKKIKVVHDVIERLGLENVTAQHVRAEELKKKYDFVVTRAVAPAKQLLLWSKKLIDPKHKNIIPNGIIALKGGDLKEELKELGKGEYYEKNPIQDFFPEPYFQEKFVIYIQG